ncbi:MAG: MBL fold metallo-hydrolase [Kordiimonas sp.]|nr:MBL fold metallo-hydrolase [Kordiimonas sp.]|tara:strand:+ start:1552 stop:2457 length:906 start_codon:yes stop_codon:yes gene_type:complete
MTGIPFKTEFDPHYGDPIPLSARIRRIVADNASPFTHWGTNSFIIGHGTVALIDPGPAIPSHIQAIKDAIAGEAVSHILLTHNHRDHSPAAHPLSVVTGAPTYAYDISDQQYDASRSEEGLDKHFKPDHLLHHGDVLSGPDWTIEVLHTPGHLSNHLCFALQEEKAVFTGDHVMGWSTSVVSPPDGNMKDYLDSLRLLKARDDKVYFPAHGPRIDKPQAYVRAMLGHRRARENQILQCVAAGTHTIPQMVNMMYADVAPHLHPAAQRSVYAHILHMVETGRLACDGEPDIAQHYTLPEQTR